MTLTFLWRWLSGSRRMRPDLHVLVYTRKSCPLCDHALELLQRYQVQYGFTIETKDVDESEQLVHDYGNCVPVVAINGKVRFRGQVNEVLLRRLLEAP